MAATFITGGYGFLGQYIVQAVHEHDPQAELRILVRTPRKTFLNLEKLPRARWLPGELTNPETYRAHLAGVDTLIHNAALVSFRPADSQRIFEANVLGTRGLFQAARQAGVRNFIFISSISAMRFNPPQLTDENCLPDLETKKKTDMYGYSKRLSEIELAEYRHEMRIITLNPSVILGPGSERVETALRALRWLPLVPMLDFANAFVDVRDVAHAVTLALSQGRSGERYLVSAYNTRMLAFTRLLLAQMGRKTPVLRVPDAGLKLADGLVALLDGLHINPGLRAPSLMNIDKAFSHAKISAEMGWEPRTSLEQSIADSLRAAASR